MNILEKSGLIERKFDMIMNWVIGIGILVLIIVASSEKAESIMELSEGAEW